ncbi:potassium channel family protein [Clostridium sp. Marseille-P299]|uniref:potassium channel family protein n=1 Tax=Clostridium sp. Marseille-P299 TaxID=1805477 RepID=UPI000830466A|nr:TrkA family potassium uptake protein [Clostridium sp. Marseille-P299]
MFQHRSAIEYGVVGLGRFGSALAKTLAEAGKEVIVVDNNESKVKQIRNVVTEAFVVGTLDKENLEETGIQNCQTVIVCIGTAIDTSILTTLNLISMGVPRVIAKAISIDQGSVLEKIGAEVVYPEIDMAVRLANRLVYSKGLDFIKLDGDVEVSEIKVSKKLVGLSVVKADLRSRFNLNIIAIEHQNITTIQLDPDYVFTADDVLVVIGKKKHISNFEAYLAD